MGSGQVVQRLHGIDMLRPIGFFPPGQNLGKHIGSFGIIPLKHVQIGQIIDRSHSLGIARPLPLGLDGNHCFIQGLGLVEHALAFVQQSKIVIRSQSCWICFAKGNATGVCRLTQIGFGTIEDALFFQYFTQIIG